MSNVLTKWMSQYPYITKNEKKIAKFILNSPQKVIKMRSQDLASLLDTLHHQSFDSARKLLMAVFTT